MAYKQAFVAVEINEEVVAKYSEEHLPFIYGNASEDNVLKKAGIEKASSLICALYRVADLFIVLSGRQINPKLKNISRVTEESSYRKLKLGGGQIM